MRMKNPPHPGRIVRQECVEPLGLTVTQAARALGVTRQALNNLVNGKAGVSRRWPSGFPRPSAAAPKYGSGYRWNTIWRGRKRKPDTSRSGGSSQNTLRPRPGATGDVHV